MELLQKLTLYDLFGYTLPGVLAVWLYLYGGDMARMDGFSVGSLCMLVILGYVAGALITEVAERLEWAIEKIINKKAKWENYTHEKFWCGICENYKVSKDMVTHALEQAKVTDYDQSFPVDVLVKDYATYMYSEIQASPEYDRLDTYASAELLYKNMFLVSLFTIGLGICRQQYVQIVIGVLGAVFFAIRRVRFAERSRGYAISWFIQKYGRE